MTLSTDQKVDGSVATRVACQMRARTVAARVVSLGGREEVPLAHLVHPVFATGRVYAWEILTAEVTATSPHTEPTRRLTTTEDKEEVSWPKSLRTQGVSRSRMSLRERVRVRPLFTSMARRRSSGRGRWRLPAASTEPGPAGIRWCAEC